MAFTIKTLAEIGERERLEEFNRVSDAALALIREHNPHARPYGVRMIVALDDETHAVVGVNALKELTPFLTECKYLVVSKTHRRQGIGKALARKILELVPSKFAICSITETNERCHSLAIMVGWVSPGASFPSRLHPEKRIKILWFEKPDPPRPANEVSEFEASGNAEAPAEDRTGHGVPAEPPREG